MLRRIQAQLGIGLEGFDLRDESIPTGPASSRSEHISPAADMASGSAYTNSPSDGHRGSNDENHGGHSALDPAGLGMMVGSNVVPVEGSMDIGIQQHMDATDPWGISQMQSGYDWNQFDALTRGPTDNIPQMPQAAPLADQNWLDQNNYNDFGDFLAANSWNTFPSM
ncbi:hypothetical protein SAMD00023353_0600180 [Rosellinia necatrix]|uniref:Uncharacterized protein n=1 Tax=Rosellinia necatrix TaxID=77044 RepID=A0A1S8A5M6_ROSNE|nr:hypothetical protein SAMD00023353_0600180 [Rosellinia necatrix]